MVQETMSRSRIFSRTHFMASPWDFNPRMCDVVISVWDFFNLLKAEVRSWLFPRRASVFTFFSVVSAHKKFMSSWELVFSLNRFCKCNFSAVFRNDGTFRPALFSGKTINSLTHPDTGMVSHSLTCRAHRVSIFLSIHVAPRPYNLSSYWNCEWM